jgi:hypothetical protein
MADIMIGMNFFIRDLHQQIQNVHQEQLPSDCEELLPNISRR